MTKPTDETFITNHIIKYNLIYSDVEWREFHDIVLATMNKDMLLPELLVLYNRLPEYVQTGTRMYGFDGLAHHLRNIQDEDLYPSKSAAPMVNENPNVIALILNKKK